MPEPEYNFPVPRTALALLLTAAFFVAPLLFFTGLTRNPYYLQITILNIAVLGAVALYLRASLKAGAWQLPVTPLTRPLAALTLVYGASFVWSWFGHESFFRPAMAAEGLKAGLFFLTNCLAVFYLALSVPSEGRDSDVPVGKWLAFVLSWGALWFLFPWLRLPPSGDGLFSRLFDPYGALVWVSGFTAAYLLIRRCRQQDILHLALSAGAIASVYGILEYCGIELVWAKLLNPYGNRSVSTFGNPNFISTYVVIFLPLAASLLMKADTGVKRAYYGLVFLSYGGMLMASLTRSSWLGAAAAFIFLFSFASHRGQLKANKKFLYPFFAVSLFLLFLWPADARKPFSSGLVDRVSEAVSGIRSPAALSLSGDHGRTYSSFHQRLLIWTSAWQMGLENPLLGKGWGQFELFYPFYQGRLMANFPVMRGLRTHANNAHNEILEQWSQAGLLGLGAYLWFLVVLFYGFIRFYRAAGAEARYEVVPLAAGLAGALCDNLLNVSIHFAVPGLAFWWVAGALALKTSGVGTYPAWKRPRAAAAAWVLLLCCFGAAWLWERQFTREFRYFNGFRAMRTNNFPAAVAELRGAWEANPREVNSNYELGNAYVRAGELEKGAWAYGEALRANSGYDEIYFNLAIILKRLGRGDEALKHLRVSSVINPLNLTTWQAIAEVYLSMPDKQAAAAGAAADFEEAVRIFPGEPGMWNTLGYFYTLLKNYEAARTAYGRGVKADPGSAMLAENLAGVSRQLGLKHDPDLAWLAAYARAERAAASAGDIPAGELKAADALLALDPVNPKARLLRAKIYFKAGRLPETREALEQLLKEDYSDNQARYGLAIVYEKEGNTSRARAEWQRFLQLEPGNTAVAQRLQALR